MKLYQITIQVTNRCNARCHNCSIWKIRNHKDFSNKTFKNFCENLATKYNPKILCLMGGEPFLRNDFVDLCKTAEKAFNKDIVSATNGSMPERILKMVEEANIQTMCISIDGTKYNGLDLQKKVRGIPFETIMKTGRGLMGFCKTVFHTPTFNKLNVKYAKEIIELGLKNFTGVIPSVYREDEYFSNKMDLSLALDRNDIEHLKNILNDFKHHLSCWSLKRYLENKDYPFRPDSTKFYDYNLKEVPVPLHCFEPVSVAAGVDYNFWTRFYWKSLWKMDAKGMFNSF